MVSFNNTVVILPIWMDPEEAMSEIEAAEEEALEDGILGESVEEAMM